MGGYFACVGLCCFVPKTVEITQKGQDMLSWEKADKLNEIAQNTTMSADERTKLIRDFMCFWGALVNETCDVTDIIPDWSDGRIPREPVIDPSREAMKARIPLTGQVGATYHPGY